MSIPNSFKNRSWAIPLSDLDDNFTNLDTRVSALETGSGFDHWTFEEISGVLYFKYDGVSKFSLDSSGNMKVVAEIKSHGEL